MRTNSGYALINSRDEDIPISQRLELQNKTIPSLNRGEVLVKILATPVNPSDLVYLLGKYGVPPQNGAYAGFEACGEVVDTNAGLYGHWLRGKRVALFASPGKDGTWAKYAITGAGYCLPVRKELSDAQASTVIVNPCTSVCLVERAIELKAKAIVLNAAASQVGKGVIRYANQAGLKTIATVRSEVNKAVLENLGADEVLITSEPDYPQQLKSACKKYHPNVFLDAVADEDTALTLSQMPNGSTAIVYGRLTETHHPYGGSYGVADLIFRNVRIEGFWLAHFIRKAGAFKTMRLSKKVQKLFVNGIFDTDIYGQFSLQDFPEALEHYATYKSDGKVILTPNNPS